MGNIRTDSRGVVSITVTIVLMLVISLTILSFGQTVRREQRQTLDRQLSSQAFYAAESGINDIRKYIKTNYAGQIPPSKTDCGATTQYDLTGTIDSETGTGYTCLLVGSSPKKLNYTLSRSAPAKVFPVSTIDPADIATPTTPITAIDFTWKPVQANAAAPLVNCDTSVPATIPSATATGYQCAGFGVLRVDLVPYPAAGQTRENMQSDGFTAFLWPTANNAPATVSYEGSGDNIYGGSANQGARARAACDSVSCRVSVTGLNSSRYYARVSTIYRDSVLEVSARGAGGQDLSLFGAQITIDSTGKSQDVLRRVQVRVPLTSGDLVSDYGLQTTESLCKTITAFPDSSYTRPPAC